MAKMSVIFIFRHFWSKIKFWYKNYVVSVSSNLHAFLGPFILSLLHYATGGTRQTTISVCPRCPSLCPYEQLLVSASSTLKALGWWSIRLHTWNCYNHFFFPVWMIYTTILCSLTFLSSCLGRLTGTAFFSSSSLNSKLLKYITILFTFYYLLLCCFHLISMQNTTQLHTACK